MNRIRWDSVVRLQWKGFVEKVFARGYSFELCALPSALENAVWSTAVVLYPVTITTADTKPKFPFRSSLPVPFTASVIYSCCPHMSVQFTYVQTTVVRKFKRMPASELAIRQEQRSKLRFVEAAGSCRFWKRDGYCCAAGAAAVQPAGERCQATNWTQLQHQ